jgi:uncharacterized BrkB/YihY/UPF0761 family membrane protein
VLAEYKRKTNIGVGLGIVLEVLGRVLMNGTAQGQVLIGSIIAIAGFVLFIWGCAQYARGKGHSPWFGALGMLSIIGLLILFFLSDRHRVADA